MIWVFELWPSMWYVVGAMEPNERWDEIWSEKRRVTSGRLGPLIARDVIHRTVDGILKREIPQPAAKSILEPGSGTGLVSLELARRGAAVVLLDLSSEAVSLSRVTFGKAKADRRIVQASILAIPFKDNSFDIAWNGGVIEHFDKGDQVRIIREMLRVTKPGGRVILIAPSSQASIYAAAKAHADSQRAWKPGYEVPMRTFRDLAEEVPGRLLYEYRTGLLAELHFLKYYFAKAPWLRTAWVGTAELISRILFPLNRLPGYLLVAVFEKPPQPARPGSSDHPDRHFDPDGESGA
jgi:ubiquinone/menaquinone biosynthesis C-methylase UbiE